MKKFLLFFFFFLFLLLPSFVSAEIISVDTNWSPPNVYVIDSSFSVAPGVTLTIEPGTIIKARATGLGGPSIYGRLIARGTEESPIYFTSFYNDDIGGDTDGNGPTPLTQGDWQGLYFKLGSEGVFDYVDLSYSGYGGYGYGDFVGIENDGGTVAITNSNLHDNFRYFNVWGFGATKSGFGIWNRNNGVLSVSNSIIDNSLFGIYNENGNSLEATNNIIKNNWDDTGYSIGYGVYAYGSGSVTLLNNSFVNNDKTAFIDAAIDFIHDGNTSEDRRLKGFLINGYVKDGANLHSKDLPLVINGFISAMTGKSFTVNAGAILKGLNGGYISAEGGIANIEGTEEKPVIFTSVFDDSVGGDTNNDSNATNPGGPNVTAGIQIGSGGAANISNLEIKYSHTGITATGGSTKILNSTFHTESLSIPIHVNNGNLSVSHSRFVGSPNFQIQNYGSTVVDAKNNWWGDKNGPYHPNLNPAGASGSVQDNIDFIPWLTADPALTPPAPQIHPIIIIPGIMGSAYKNGKLLIDPILHTYDDLMATLEANGYEKEKNLFTFPYEWRDSNVITANLLKDKISAVKTACEIAQEAGAISQALGVTDCSKIDLVAHSMGGLVAREYIQSGQYRHDVDQLIFLGTPHRGSPKTYLQWEAGEFPDDTLSIFLRIKFGSEALKNLQPTIFDYIRNRPIASVQELLPTFDYLKDKDTGIIRAYPDNYPRNIFLEALNTNTGIQKLLNSGVKITNIIGNSGNNTIEKIRVGAGSNPLWVDGKPDGFDGQTTDRGLEKGGGDGTVTINGSILDNSISNEEWPNVDHQGLPRETSARIFNLLTNKTATDVIFLSPVEKIFSIQLQSPIDVVIIAPDGKKIGKNFATGEEYDEIAGAFYSGFNNGDEEYITIPNPIDGNYKIEVQGTGNGGEYGVLTSYISDNFATTTETGGITKPNQITELDVKINNQNPGDLETERVITLEVFKNDINGAYDLGWVKDKKSRDMLIRQVERAVKLQKRIETVIEKLPDGTKRKKRVEKLEIKIDKIMLKLFSEELDLMIKKQKINQEAFDLLKTDVKYLLENN